MALADVFPDQLAFHWQPGRSLCCHFEVANSQPGSAIAFKLKTNAPSDYVVKPGKVCLMLHQDVLEAGQSWQLIRAHHVTVEHLCTCKATLPT